MTVLRTLQIVTETYTPAPWQVGHAPCTLVVTRLFHNRRLCAYTTRLMSFLVPRLSSATLPIASFVPRLSLCSLFHGTRLLSLSHSFFVLLPLVLCCPLSLSNSSLVLAQVSLVPRTIVPCLTAPLPMSSLVLRLSAATRLLSLQHSSHVVLCPWFVPRPLSLCSSSLVTRPLVPSPSVTRTLSLDHSSLVLSHFSLVPQPLFSCLSATHFLSLCPSSLCPSSLGHSVFVSQPSSHVVPCLSLSSLSLVPCPSTTRPLSLCPSSIVSVLYGCMNGCLSSIHPLRFY